VTPDPCPPELRGIRDALLAELVRRLLEEAAEAPPPETA
jgi:hypothetical protein